MSDDIDTGVEAFADDDDERPKMETVAEEEDEDEHDGVEGEVSEEQAEEMKRFIHHGALSSYSKNLSRFQYEKAKACLVWKLGVYNYYSN